MPLKGVIILRHLCSWSKKNLSPPPALPYCISSSWGFSLLLNTPPPQSFLAEYRLREMWGLACCVNTQHFIFHLKSYRWKQKYFKFWKLGDFLHFTDLHFLVSESSFDVCSLITGLSLNSYLWGIAWHIPRLHCSLFFLLFILRENSSLELNAHLTHPFTFGEGSAGVRLVQLPLCFLINPRTGFLDALFAS